MHFRLTLRVLGLLLMLFSFTQLPPLAISVYYDDSARFAFMASFFILLCIGFAIWVPVYRVKGELRVRDGFLITVLFWSVLGLFGATPLYLAPEPQMSFVDAVFESISGLSTTGATVITGLDHLPKSILFYRQQLQWLGGMGIIVLAVAILPMLGIGGMQLYRAEIPGPVKDTKLTPRITETAKALWYIYAALTLLCALAYWLAGMTPFDAIGHSFSTVAIGGFSTYDDSIGYFNNPMIELIGITFMIISAMNFALHFFAWRQRSLLHYLKDPEVRFFLSILMITFVITLAVLIIHQTYDSVDALRRAAFMTVSIATTAGFSNGEFANWPVMLPFMLFITAFIGGCVGSTGGGMKVIRILLILKQGYRELQRLVHPNAVFPVKLGNRTIPDNVLQAVWGFFSVYLLVFVIMLIALMGTGLDQVTAWSAVGATITNLGPGLGDVASNFGDINSTAKWILCFSMLLGRLEVFTLLVLFTPVFWRR
ncbi:MULTISPECIES: TrkH family potassium uptake protein [Nitrincola]|uniref:Trk system potassium uptake protein n=1 Tax=Nitrincola nitratireducens TaxID=1229521 RepID=W9USQ9_9GAMM|nr:MULTISPECIES: TrkH family potassium uptake protein [Nitrincola]EXJ10134.1 Trk system potassium uptake protein trkG [Nitrincola nitratireducens]